MKINSFVIMAMAAVLLSCGCVNNNGPGNGGNIGGQTDEHGCLAGAGYSFDKDVGACTRSWELNADQKKAAKIAIAPLSFPVTVVGVDAGNCSGCFVVHLQRNDNQNRIDTRLENWAFTSGSSTTIQDNPGMTYAEARKIAVNSACVADGKLTDKYFYNSNSKTWWIDLDTVKKGCAPACVVSEETKTAEINWRCTGLITPDSNVTPVNSFDDCAAAGYPVIETYPEQCSTPDGRNFVQQTIGNPVTDANNRFAFDLYAKYKSNDGNVFFLSLQHFNGSGNDL